MYSILSSLPFGSHLVIQDGIQTISTPTWATVFTFLQSQHFHAEGKCTTPHTESLWEHLIRCGELAHAKALAMGLSAHEAKKAYFAGFLHDIGKPATLTRSSTHLAYKGHGIVGGAILENAWTPELGAALQFSPADWADISMLADVHMCGYFPHQTTPQHAVGFQILPDSVKRLLPCLRWGDIAATQSSDPERFPTDPAPDEARFLATLFTPLNIQELATKYRGILIQLCGSSGAGKTTVANWLRDELTKRGCVTHVISRDVYTVRESMQRLGEPWNGDITPAIYQKAHGYYVSTGKAFAADINAAMKTDITAALQKGHIVILDTLMTRYPHTLKSILPDTASKQPYKLNLWVHRNTLFTEEEAKGRLGMSLTEQLAVHGDTGIAWNPFKAGLWWHTLISATEQ